MCVCMYVCTYVSTYICMCVRMYVCMYVGVIFGNVHRPLLHISRCCNFNIDSNVCMYVFMYVCRSTVSAGISIHLLEIFMYLSIYYLNIYTVHTYSTASMWCVSIVY